MAVLKALAAKSYETPTPIQLKAIPPVLAGRDLLGIAQTGTGKTCAFATPILDRLTLHARRANPRTCRALVLSPTRELASQIEESFRTYCRFLKLTSTVVFGGVPINRQIRQLQNGVDVVVATPGRLLDLINQRALSLAELEIFVLDEADQMLDMGFIHDIRKIVAMLPKARQSLFFSATMPREMADIAGKILRDPAHVAVTPAATTVDKVEQKVIFCDTRSKQALLHKLLEDNSISRALVFSRTKHGANRIVQHLDAAGIPADAIHGNKSQPQRERALAAFREGQSRLLVATDIAARGIDVDGVTHVINFDLPNVPESYVHRIGRTARAGADGIAISFCDREERAYLRDIERLTRQRVPVLDMGLAGDLPPLPKPAPARPDARPNHHGKPRNGHGRNGQAQHGKPRDFRDGGRPGNAPREANGAGSGKRPFQQKRRKFEGPVSYGAPAHRGGQRAPH
ncbi:MAG TPA: DEAD/DEAH box helicase [Beijerinckiaceae bacterium]|nr:DEAD/DEAH box helicase [Beijerinckiaceae bacterium]